MPQLSKISRNNTTVRNFDGGFSVTLHSTQIVTVYYGKKIILDNGGWNTVTTANRMTQTAREKNLPFGISRKDGVMYLHQDGKEKVPFGANGRIEFKI